jgi:hypothetical protein
MLSPPRKHARSADEGVGGGRTSQFLSPVVLEERSEAEPESPKSELPSSKDFLEFRDCERVEALAKRRGENFLPTRLSNDTRPSRETSVSRV